MVGEDRAIKRVANIMSRPPSSGDAPSPLASFLFLPFSWVRLEEFFESLAEELYDSKDRLAWFNLKMRTNSTSTLGLKSGNHLIFNAICIANESEKLLCKYTSSEKRSKCRDEWDAIQEKIIEVVKSTPFCALLFENAGASEYTTAFLENILKHGKLVDKQGKAYDLSNTLIIMTSTFGCGIDVRKALKCNCKYLEMDCPMVEDAGTMSSKDLECERLLLHKKVLGPLWDIHELVDDVLVLNGLPLLAREVITRVQLRNELEASGKEKQLILYPSEAVVRLIIYSYVDLIEKDGLESCIKKEIIPSIYLGIEGMQPLNMATIHMDALVGSMEKWSYRPLEVGSALAAFKESLSQWKTMYQNEKRSATEIVELSTLCSQLLFLMQNVNEPDRVIKWLKDMENNLDSIISNQVNSSFIQCELNLVPPKIELPEIETKVPYPVAYSNVMEGVRSKFSSAPGGKYRLLSLIANAFSSTRLGEGLCCHPKSYLFLGLTDNAKADLFNALSHLCESGDAYESIIQINMEEYADSDSLMQFVDCIAAFALQGSSGTESSLSDCTQTNQCRVLLIDRVGKADISVFSALLSLLDHGALANLEGKLVDFSRTVVIITSDVGNEEILAGLAGHARGSIIKEESAEQRTKEAFRFELLRRIDEIFFFDPLLEQQLERFYRLPIKMNDVKGRQPDLLLVARYFTLNLDKVHADDKKLFFAMAVRGLGNYIQQSRNTTVRKRVFCDKNPA